MGARRNGRGIGTKVNSKSTGMFGDAANQKKKPSSSPFGCLRPLAPCARPADKPTRYLPKARSPRSAARVRGPAPGPPPPSSKSPAAARQRRRRSCTPPQKSGQSQKMPSSAGVRPRRALPLRRSARPIHRSAASRSGFTKQRGPGESRQAHLDGQVVGNPGNGSAAPRAARQREWSAGNIHDRHPPPAA